jgi:hypothetical protein
LVVVAHTDAVLMMFDSWPKQWELPGGMRKPGWDVDNPGRGQGQVAMPSISENRPADR